MAKRKAGSDEGSPNSKRKKLSRGSKIQGDGGHSKRLIQTTEDLQLLLSSTQLEVDELLERVRTFKSFLDVIVSSGSHNRSVKSSILLDYLRPYVFIVDKDATKFVPDIIKIAHHAGQINSENLFSSTMAVLALLLKTISSLHEFRDIGNSLCRLILHESHVKMIEHGMSAAKSKEHLISPCLRLLKEIVLFDGGTAAKTVYRLRHITFRRLDVFLAMRGTSRDNEGESRRRQSVRNITISYLIANVRLQSQTAKCYILSQNKWMRSLLSNMGDDPPNLVSGIIDTFRKEVAENETFPLSVKGRFFDGWTLGRLASLYEHKNYSLDDEQGNVEKSAHAILEVVCASSDHGLLAAVEKERSRNTQNNDDDESDNERYLSSNDRGDIRRIQRNISSFLQRLRPYANLFQSDLMLSCFQNYPRLLDDYFSGQAAFSFDPKLSLTWVGYSQFLLGIIQQPVPEQIIRSCSEGDQKSVELLVHLILPPPLTQKALTQCLSQRSDLVTFFTMRILVAAFEKFITANQLLKSNKQRNLEDLGIAEFEKEDKLLESFSKRLPKIRDVVVQLKNCPFENVMLRESISRLLMLYHSGTPQLAIEENADGSFAISNALVHFEEGGLDEKKDGMLLLELEHIIEIASRLPDMHWWHQISESFSPYTSLLKIHVKQKQSRDRIGEILRSVAEETSITWPGTPVTGFEVLALSLQSQAGKEECDTYAFLDDCLRRCAKKTVIYGDQLHNIMNSFPSSSAVGETSSPPDLLLITFMEQLPHLIARRPDDPVVAVTRFLRLYINFSALRGVDRDVLVFLRDIMIEFFPKEDECRLVMEKSLREPLDTELQLAFGSLRRISEDLCQSLALPEHLDMEIKSEAFVPPSPPAADSNHRGLARWMREDIQDAITDGAIEELILCLCSAHEEIRRQALTGIRAFICKLEPSGYREWQQIHLLAGELAETAGTTDPECPLPYFVGVLAARLLQVLVDPLHVMYGKVNIFLSRRPQWTPEKLPSYWVDKIILRPPTDDNSHYQEVEWLLDTLISGLRGPDDMEIYRRCHIIERILTLATSPDLPKPCFEKIIDLLFRCTYVKGSTTLITRCGLIGWLSVNMAVRDDSMKPKLKVLGRQIYETSDQTRVNDWANGSLVAMLDGLDMLHE